MNGVKILHRGIRIEESAPCHMHRAEGYGRVSEFRTLPSREIFQTPRVHNRGGRMGLADDTFNSSFMMIAEATGETVKLPGVGRTAPCSNGRRS